MKLTAPPPPPAPSPEPAGNDLPNPNAAAPESPTPPAEAAAPPAPAKIAVWPAWFAGADFLLAALVLCLAFLVSSFIARNPDIWLHLAAGKRLLAGEYKPGTDPFSYSGVDRVWVNHSLLFDVGAYLLYGGDGVLLVVFKALAVALAFGLLIGIRRKEFPLWHWAVAAGIGVMVAAPRMLLTPLVGSVLLLSVTMVLLFRMTHRAGSWRFPIAIGITFWIWAQVDAWFFLGPLVIGLTLFGEWIQYLMRKGVTTAEIAATPNPLGTLPDVPTLAKAFGVGVLDCMLNPHHIHIWQLPFELVGMAGASEDARLKQVLLLGPLDKIYFDNVSLGKSLNGVAYAIAFLGGGVALGLGIGRIRLAHILLWISFALLSLRTIYAIPFFAVVAVPLVAAQLNAFSVGVSLKSWSDPRTKFLLLGSATGRVIALMLLIAACILSLPGWMQPDAYNAAFSRRVAWGVEPDPGLVRAAEKLQSWRQSGRLPADYRGIIASTDLANYCAWFAPLEKVYLNGNFNHHRKELPDYINIRGDLGLNYREGKPPDERAVGTLMNKVGAEYLAFASTQGETPNSRYLIALSVMRLWGDAEHWSPWFWDGRNAIGGWQAEPSSKGNAFAALRLDPIELAFGPNVQRLPAETVRQLAPPEGWEGEFLHGVGMTPPGVDEAIGWQLYKESVQLRYYVGEQLAGQLMNACLPLPNESIMHRRMLQFLGYPNRPQPETLAAIPFLSLRAARRAIAADPDHPDGYFVLYQALSDPELPLTEVERTIGQVTALRQCLMRLPTPERFRPNIYRAQPHAIARALAVHYYGRSKEKGLPVTGLPLDAPAFIILAESPLSAGAMGLAAENGRAFSVLWKFKNEARQIIGGPTLRAVDLARETMDLARRYAEKELDPNKPAEAKMLKDLKDDCKGIEEEYIKRNSQYERDKSAAASSKAILVEQVRAALRSNLVGEALRILTDKATDLPKEYGARIFEIVLIRMSLEMLTGRLEEAAADMEEAPKVIDSTPLPPDAKPEAIAQYRAVSHLQLDQMEYQKLNFEGNYQGAGDLLERNSQQVGKDLPPDPAESAFKLSKAIVDLGFERVLNGFDYIPVASLAFLGREVMVADAMKPFVQRQQKLRNVRSEAADFYYRRGFLSLLEGDIPSAKKRFEQSRQPGIPEWGIPEQRSQSAERLLKLIEEAEKATAK